MNWTQKTLSIAFGLCTLSGLAMGQEQVAGEQPARSSSALETDLKRLQSAADADPSDLGAQLSYAQQLFRSGKTAEAWQRLRTAYQTAPENKGVLMGLQAVLDRYKLQGKLNVGTPENQVFDLLGPSHLSRKMPWGMRHVYGTLAVDFRDGKVYELVQLVGATEALFDASHVVHVDLDGRSWPIGLRQKGDGLTTAYLYPEGETIAKWKEMVTIERIVRGAEGRTMKEVLATAEKQIQEAQPEAKVTIIEIEESSAIFGVLFPSSDNQPARQQLVRLWMAPRDVHRLAYTHQGEPPTNAEAKKWFDILKKAELKPYDPSVSPTSLENSPRNRVRKIAEGMRNDFRSVIQYKPTEKVLGAIAATAEDQQKLQAYCDAVYKEIGQGGTAGRPEQTEILVFGPSLEELPGGYNSVREHFKDHVKFYGFKYVVPGEKLGMSFDGAFEVDGAWYFLPKVHRAFR